MSVESNTTCCHYVTSMRKKISEKMPGAGKSVIRISVTKHAKAIIENWADAQDMTEQGLASRIYEWFGSEDEAVQRTILGLAGGYSGDLARLVLLKQAIERDGGISELKADLAQLAGATRSQRRRGGGQKSGRGNGEQRDKAG